MATSSDWAGKDFYQVLGVAKDATGDEIKKAYRKLARANHPDAKPGDANAEGRFKAISEAYSVLSSPDKRKEYDEQRAMFGSGVGARGGMRFPGGGGPGGPAGFDISDLLGGIFGNGGGTRSTASRPRRGADVE